MMPSLNDENAQRSLSRRSILAASAWTVPAVALAASAPLAAASTNATLSPRIRRRSDDGTFRDYIADFTLRGPNLPTSVLIQWVPADPDSWGLFDQSSTVTYLSGDYTSSATYILQTSSPSFWFQTQTPLTSNIPSYAVQALDQSTSAVIATATLTFTGSEPVVLSPSDPI